VLFLNLLVFSMTCWVLSEKTAVEKTPFAIAPLQQWFCVYVSVPHSRAAHSLPFACSPAFAAKQQFVVFLSSSDCRVRVDVW
jgi:hypothetical protein